MTRVVENIAGRSSNFTDQMKHLHKQYSKDGNNLIDYHSKLEYFCKKYEESLTLLNEGKIDESNTLDRVWKKGYEACQQKIKEIEDNKKANYWLKNTKRSVLAKVGQAQVKIQEGISPTTGKEKMIPNMGTGQTRPPAKILSAQVKK